MSDSRGTWQPAPPPGTWEYPGNKSFSTAPGTVKAVVILDYIAAAALLLGGIFFALVGAGNIDENFSFGNNLVALAAVVFLAFAALNVFIARGVARGSRAWWIVAVIFSLFALLSEISRLGNGGVSGSLLFAIAEAVLLMLPDTRNYCS